MSDKIVSPSQHYELDIQDDGNLVIYRRDGSVVWSVGVDPTPLPPPTPPPMPTLTPLQVREGRLRNEAGWLHWSGLSEFSAVHLVRTGQEVELVRRLDRARAAGRNGIRVLMMAHNLFDLAPSMVGYWSAANVVVQLAQARGLYVEAVGFADAQTVMPDAGSRRGRPCCRAAGRVNRSRLGTELRRRTSLGEGEARSTSSRMVVSSK